MHLIPENIAKNLLTLWTGDFKGLNMGNEDYRLSESTVKAIGEACAARSGWQHNTYSIWHLHAQHFYSASLLRG
jgi:hypothetical protein